MTVTENVSLLPYNTFGIAAQARYFAEVANISELQELLRDVHWKDVPKLMLGGGSNVLLVSQFVDKLVIKITIGGIEVKEDTVEYTTLRAGAGVNWHDFVMFCIRHRYAGVENLSLIPGTVGATPIQNIGAYGVEVRETITGVTAVHLQTAELRHFSNEECKFGYRDSVFKNELKGQYIITHVDFRLSKIPAFNVSYGAIRDTLREMKVEELSLAAVSEAVCHIRRSKLPDPVKIGNAGSFFKNPEIPKAQYEALKEQYATMPGYITSDATVKVPAGWLIEQCGWKGRQVRQAGVHKDQALVLVNHGGATGNDIYQLAQAVQHSVEEKFGIRLHPEVNIV